MIDTTTIKEHYANMQDGQLIRIAIEDGHDLTPEAFMILKAEFKKRNLDFSYMEAAEQKKNEIQEEKIQKVRDSVGDDLSKVIWKYILEEKENETTDSVILNGLQERGIDEAQSILLLGNLNSKLKEIIDQNDTKMLVGGLAFTAGLFITVWSYSQTLTSGGTYVVAWGAVLFGAIRFFTGMADKGKYRRLLAKITSHESNV